MCYINKKVKETLMNKAKVAMSIRLNPHQHQALNNYAESENKSLSVLIDDAINQYLESKKVITTLDTDSEDLYIKVTATDHQDGYDEISLHCYHHAKPLLQVKEVPEPAYKKTIEFLHNSVNFIVENIL